MSITTLASLKAVRVLNPTSIAGIVSLIGVAVAIGLLLRVNNTIFSILIVLAFAVYGLLSLQRLQYAAWFSTVCFFCGSESILRNGLPAVYMFFYIYLVLSGFVFLVTRNESVRFKIRSATGAMFLLVVIHFVHIDFQELRFGLGKWGVLWMGVFFAMWICQNINLNVHFYRCIWFYMLGGLVVLISFLLEPIYFSGRYWPTFDGTGPVAASTGLLLLVFVQHIDRKRWFSLTNIVLATLICACIVALVMLASRGTFLALAVAAMFFLLTIRGIWNKVLVGLSIVLGLWLVYYVDQSAIGNQSLSSRIEEATEEDTREGRRFINRAVFLSFPEDPILGKGTGSWRHYNAEYIAAVFDRRYRGVVMTDAHNTSLHLLFEHGIVGAGLFLVAFFYLSKRGWSQFRLTSIFVIPFLIFSFVLGISTMHKQASMFLPFFIAVMPLSITREKRR